MRRSIRSADLSHLLIATCLLLTIQGCLLGRSRDDHGEVAGVPGRAGWSMKAPLDMVFIPGGSFVIGAVDQDVACRVNPPRQVAVSSLYVDKFQVTNNKYRQFIDALLEQAASVYGEQSSTDDQKTEEEASSVVEGSASEEAQDTSSTVSEEFIMQTLYPDMNVWQNDFAHHMADRMVEHYYDHPLFDNFPVVGITWEAARYFAEWRTKYLNDYRAERGLAEMPKFRLPTAAEWTFVARGGKKFAKYPWGGPYVRNEEGELLANFKSSRGDYRECQYDHTSPVDHFPSNDYGLHIGGNVSEWTIDAYNPAAVVRMWDLNPVFFDENEPRKIIKGGSWKDISRFLQTDAIDYEHKDRRRSFIGFRCVMSHIGEEPTNN